MRRTRTILIVIFVSIIAAIIGILTFSNYQDDLAILNSDRTHNVIWASARVGHQIRDLADKVEHEHPDTAKRYEALVNDLGNLIDEAESGDDTDTKILQAAEELLYRLVAYKQSIVGNDAGRDVPNAQLVKTLRQDIVPLQNIVSERVLDVTSSSLDNFQLARNRAYRSIVLSILTLLMAAIGIGYFVWLSDSNLSLAVRNRDLATRANNVNAVKTQLLTMLSHEIRTPLNGVLGLSSLLLNQELPEEHRGLLRELHRSGEDIADFLEELEDVSDFTLHDEESTPVLIFPQLLADQVNDSLKTLSERYHCKCEFTLDPDHIRAFYANLSRLQQVYVHLASYLCREAEQQQILLQLRVEEGRLALRVDLAFDNLIGDTTPLAILTGEPEKYGNRLNSSDLEAVLFQGLLQGLGGHIKVIKDPKRNDNYRVLIFIPTPRRSVSRVRAFCQDQASLKHAAVEQSFSPIAIQWVDAVNRDTNIIFMEDETLENEVNFNKMFAKHPLKRPTIIGLNDTTQIPPADYILSDRLPMPFNRLHNPSE